MNKCNDFLIAGKVLVHNYGKRVYNKKNSRIT